MKQTKRCLEETGINKSEEVASLACAKDIAERKKAEEALRASEEKYRALFNSLDEGFCIVEVVFSSNNRPIDYRFLEVNTIFEQQTGLRDAKGKLMRSLAPTHEEHWFRIYGEVALSGKPIRFTNPAEALNRYYDVYAFPVGKTKPYQVGILFRDISVRKKAEDALMQSEDRYKTLVENAPDAIIVHENGMPLFANAAALKLYESENFDQFRSLNLALSVPPEGKALALQRTRDVMAGKKAPLRQALIITLKGNIVPIEVTSNPTFYQGKPAILMLAHDITPLKKAEEALIESEKRYSQLFNSMNEMFQVLELIYDENGQAVDFYYRQVNPATEKVVGMSRSQMVGKRAKELFGTVEDYWLKALNQVNKTNQATHIENYSGAANKFWDVTAFKIPEMQNTVAILFSDVTKRKKAEQASAKSEEEFRRAIEDAPIPVIMHAEDGEVLQLSRTWTDLTGYTINEIPSFDTWLTRAAYGEGANAVRDHMHALFAGHEKSMGIEFPIRARDGRVRYWSFSASSPGVLRDGRRFIVGMAVDITKRKKAEEALKESEATAKKQVVELERLHKMLEAKNAEVEQFATKMEALADERAKKLQNTERLAAIGATAGMVGHDIRNPLQAIAGDLYLIDNDVASLIDGETKKSLQESIKSVQGNLQYIAKIVDDLQAYAKVQKPDFKQIDLNKIIEDVLLVVEIPSNLQVVIDVGRAFPLIRADPLMLKRILSNLVQNAVQAMPKGGILTISAFVKEKQAFIYVEDTGVGIPDEVKPKLFTPMVTTKSKGQGLGLAVVKRLVEALNGKITFESEVGKGTKFIVTLPISQAAA